VENVCRSEDTIKTYLKNNVSFRLDAFSSEWRSDAKSCEYETGPLGPIKVAKLLRFPHEY
jgi:hypothetical protein